MHRWYVLPVFCEEQQSTCALPVWLSGCRVTNDNIQDHSGAPRQPSLRPRCGIEPLLWRLARPMYGSASRSRLRPANGPSRVFMWFSKSNQHTPQLTSPLASHLVTFLDLETLSLARDKRAHRRDQLQLRISPARHSGGRKVDGTLDAWRAYTLRRPAPSRCRYSSASERLRISRTLQVPL